MKYERLYNFISPVTGKLPIDRGYILLGDKEGRSFASPILIDVRQDIIDLKRKIGNFEELKKLDHNRIWIGDYYNEASPQLHIGVINLPPLAEAVFPNPISPIIGDFRIPNPTFDYLSAFDWVMSGPFLPQIYATKYDTFGNPIGTDISSSLAMTQVRAAQIMKRFDNANFIVGSSVVEFAWENPKMYLIPEQLKQLYGLGTTYTFTKAQSLGNLQTGLLKNTVNNATGTLSTAMGGVDYVDFTENPIGEFVVRPNPMSKYIATIPIRVEDVETTIAGLGALKLAYDLFAAETVAKNAAQDVEIAAINTKNVTQDTAISSAETLANTAQETAVTAQETAITAEETAIAAEETAVAADLAVTALEVEFETQIAVLAGVATINALATVLGWIGLAANTKNYSEYIRGQTLNIKNTWKSTDKNDEGHNAVGDFEFRYPSGYSSDDRGHGTLWFDSNGRSDTHKSEGGLRLFSWDSGGDHLGYDDPIAPLHIGLFGYQNKYNVWPLPNPTPKYKGFIFRSEFNNEDSDSDNYRFPKNFGLYEAKRTISTLDTVRWGWDYLHPIWVYDYSNFIFYKNVKFSNDTCLQIPFGITEDRTEPITGSLRLNTESGNLEYGINDGWRVIDVNKELPYFIERNTHQVWQYNNPLSMSGQKHVRNDGVDFYQEFYVDKNNKGFMFYAGENNFGLNDISDIFAQSVYSYSKLNKKFYFNSLVDFSYIGGFYLPRGKHSDKEINPQEGVYRYNTDIKNTEFYDGLIWQEQCTKNYANSLLNNIPPSSISGYPNNSSKFLNGSGQWVTPTNNSSSATVGDFKHSIKINDHNGWLKWRDGRVLSRTTYAALWAEVVASGLLDDGLGIGIFGPGDGVTTFTMFSLSDRLIGASSKDISELRLVGPGNYNISSRFHGETLGREVITDVPSHNHVMNHNHSININSDTHNHTTVGHTHSINHTHSSFNTPSLSHTHDLVTFNLNGTNSNLDTVVYQYTTQASGNGGYVDYDGAGGVTPFRVMYNVGLRNTTTNASVSYSINIPTFSGTSGTSKEIVNNYTHSHIGSIGYFSGSTSNSGNISGVDIMNPSVFLNLFIYSGVV